MVPRFAELLSTAAQGAARRVALIDGENRHSYEDIRARADEHARRIEGATDAGAPVAIVAEKCPEHISLAWGAFISGRPCLLLSSQWPTAKRQAAMETVGVQALLTSDAVVPTGLPRRDAADLDEAVVVLTTSGSTGTPKVVPLSDRALTAFVRWAEQTFDLRDTPVYGYAPLSFDLSLLDVWSTLACGGTVVASRPEIALRGDKLADVLTAGDVRLVQAVPTFYRVLAEAAADRSFPSVRHVIFTGDHLPADVLGRLPTMFPHARLHDVYGCTETNDTFIHTLSDADLDADRLPLGTPLPGVEAVLMADGREVVGAGEGELYVTSPFQTAGYLPRERRVGVFVPDPRGGSGRTFFRSGDLVTRGDDGQMFLTGRVDSVVKIRGVRVDVAEVEKVLGSHPDVDHCAVRVDEPPQGARRLVAVVRRRDGSHLNTLRIRVHAAAVLPPQAIPETITVVDDDLPLTATGKIDRKLIDA